MSEVPDSLPLLVGLCVPLCPVLLLRNGSFLRHAPCGLWSGRGLLVPNRQYLAVRYRPAAAPELFVLRVPLPTLERFLLFLLVEALLIALLVGFLHGMLTWRLWGPCLVLA